MFLVTGASGELFGRPVLEQLRRLVPETSIVAGTRDPEAVGVRIATGITLRRFDFDEPDSMATAFDGVTAVLINGAGRRLSAGACSTRRRSGRRWPRAWHASSM